MDMTVNGLPKPWTVQEIAVWGPQLISRPSASTAEKQLPLDASGRLSSCLGPSTKSPSSPICLHSRSSSLKSLRTLSSSPDSSESGSSMHHPPRIYAMPRYISSPQSLHQAAMSSSTGFVSHTPGFTNSNAGSFCGEPECVDRTYDFHYTPNPCIEQQLNRMPFTDTYWASKNMSFVTDTEETPSPSSSFDVIDMPKDDRSTIWDPATGSTYPPSNTESTSSTTSAGRFQYEISQEYTGYTPFPTSVFSGPGDVTSYTPLIADTLLDSYQCHDMINFDWKVDQETHMQKTPPSSIQTVTYIPPPIPSTFHSTPSISPQLDLKQISMSFNPTPQQQPFAEMPQPFDFYSEYQATTTLPPDNTAMANQFTQSPPLPHLAYPQPQPQPQTQVATQMPLEARMHLTDMQNAFLIESKEKGLSYKEIKRLGNFKEAESTLRGRFRTLTKSKEQRVRKPKWTERDLTLLREAVTLYSDKERAFIPAPNQTCEQTIYDLGAYQTQQNAAPTQPPKVSWKKVGQYIVSHGGSYQFGNATCKKKWCEIHGIAP